MKLFSERYGYTKPSDVIIREKITPEIQNAICSCYDKLKNRLFLDSGLYFDTDPYIALEQYRPLDYSKNKSINTVPMQYMDLYQNISLNLKRAYFFIEN